MASLFFPASTKAVTATGCGDSIAPQLCTVQKFHVTTNKWRSLLGQQKLPLEQGVYTQPHRRAYLVWLWGVRKQRAKAAWMVYGTAVAWARQPGPRCVSSLEGGVASVNPAGYYGKWQADVSFQTAYNPRAYRLWGTANHWSEREQDLMAYHGWQHRGYSPWPNTARECGLL